MLFQMHDPDEDGPPHTLHGHSIPRASCRREEEDTQLLLGRCDRGGPSGGQRGGRGTAQPLLASAGTARSRWESLHLSGHQIQLNSHDLGC